MNFQSNIKGWRKKFKYINDLHSYLVREFKKAERNHFYTTNTFFHSLINAIEKYKAAIIKQYNHEVEKMQRVIERSGNNGYDFKDAYYGESLDKAGKAYEDFKAESNKAWFTDTKKHLSEYQIDKVKIGVDSFTMKEMLMFESAIDSALKEINGVNGYTDTPALQQIFHAAKPGYDLCLQLLRELEFVDDEGNTKPRTKANDILGLAVALKETSHNLLKERYPDNELMKVLQHHLNLPFTSNIKRRGKGYKLKKDEAKNYINSYMKTARAI
jgi:hypothetical protein